MNAKRLNRSAGSCLLASLLVAFGLAVGCSKESKQQRHLASANAHLQAGDFDKAEIEYLNVLRLDRSNRIAVESLGKIFQEQGRYAEAYRFLSMAKAIAPTNLDTRLRLAATFLTAAGYKEAREEAAFVLSQAPAHDEALTLLVDASVTTNHLQDARLRLEKLRPQAGTHPGYHLAWGNLHLRQRDATNAEIAFRKALAADTNSAAAYLGIGNVLVLKGQLKEADAAFKIAADLSPLRSPLRVRYAEFKMVTGDFAGARQVLEDLEKKVPDYLPALLQLAELELVQRNFDAAGALLKRVIARDPANLEAQRFGPRLSLARGEADKALAGFEELAKRNPKNPLAHYQVAVAAVVNNDLPKAMASLTAATTLAPDYPDAVRLLAELNLRRGDTASAVSALQRLVRRYPGLMEARFLLASAHRARGNLDEALAVYRNLARDYPTNPQPVLAVGLIQREQKKADDARASFERALGIRSGFLPALVQLLDLDVAEGKFDAAHRRVQAEIQSNPKAPEPLMLLARLYVAQTNHAQAEATLLKVAETNPNYFPAQTELAKLYVATKRERQALERLQAVVSKNTNDLMSWMLIATIQREATDYPAARDTYEKLLTLNPRFVPALNDLAWLYSEHLNDLTRAHDLALKAIQLQPGSPSTADTMGWVHFKRGDYGRALPLLLESAKSLPNEPEVKYHLGMTHYMMGEAAAARVALQNALELKSDFPGAEEAKRRLAVLAINPETVGAAQISDLEKRLRESPSDPIVLALLAGAYQRTGATDKAIDAYERSLQFSPKSVPMMVQLAQLYSGWPDKAKAALDLLHKAHDLAPADAAISHSLGRLAWREGDHKWALSLLEECARKLASDPQLLFDLGMARYSMGQVEAGLAALRSAQTNRPPPALVKSIDDILQMTTLLANPQQAEASLAKVQALLKEQSNHVPALMALAAIETRRNNPAAAQRSYEAALAAFPSFTPALRELAVLHFGPLNNRAKAHELASRVREMDKTDLLITKILGVTSGERGDFNRAADLLTEYTRQRPQEADGFFQLGVVRYKLKQVPQAKEALTKALALQPAGTFAAEAKRILAELNSGSKRE